MKASPASDAFTHTRLMPAFRVSTGLHVEHRRPKRDASHEGLLKVERREFRCLGLGVYGLGFYVYVFMV